LLAARAERCATSNFDDAAFRSGHSVDGSQLEVDESKIKLWAQFNVDCITFGRLDRLVTLSHDDSNLLVLVMI